MDSLGGFKVGDTVRCIHRTQPPDASDGAETWWQPSKEGHVGKIERIVRTGDDPFGPRWDYLVVDGNFYRPHWLEKISDLKVGDRVRLLEAPDGQEDRRPDLVGRTGTVVRKTYDQLTDVAIKGEAHDWCFSPGRLEKISDAPAKPVASFVSTCFDPAYKSPFDSLFRYKSSDYSPFTQVYDFKSLLSPNLYTKEPVRTVMPKPSAPPAISEHDELIQLRAERDSERRWAAHWKSVADSREDQFKRMTEAEVACAAATDTLEEQDQEISALKTENRALKVCRDDWMKDAAESRREKLEAQAGWGRAAVERDRALRVRNMSLAGLLVGAAGVVYQALLTTGVL
jgi:hypothetical protein